MPVVPPSITDERMRAMLYVTSDKNQAATELDEELTTGKLGIELFSEINDKTGGMPLLHLCVTSARDEAKKAACIESLQVLIQHGVDVNCKERNAGYTALCFAAMGLQMEVAEILLQAGAKVDVKSKFNQTLVDVTMATNSGVKGAEMLALLQKYLVKEREQQRAEQCNKERHQAEQEADAGGSAAAAAASASGDAEGGGGGGGGPKAPMRRPLSYKLAQSNKRPKSEAAISAPMFMQMLNTADIDGIKRLKSLGLIDDAFLSMGSNGLSFMALAAMNTILDDEKKCELLETMLDVGAKVNERGPRGETALHLAITTGCYDAAALLLVKGGADLSLAAYDNRTPFRMARTAYGAEELVSLMLQLLSNQQISEPEEVPGFLLELVHTENARLLNLLFQCQVIDATTFSTPLNLHHAGESNTSVFLMHVAAESGKVVVLREMLELGANVDQLNLSGNSPLMVATRAKQLAAIDVLLNAHASFETKNHDGQTVIDIAIDTRNQEVLMRIEAAWRKLTKNRRDTANTVFAVRSGVSSSSGDNTLVSSGSGSDGHGMFSGGAGSMMMSQQSALFLDLGAEAASAILAFPKNSLFAADDVIIRSNDVLGAGGAGAVMRAYIKSLDRPAAAKMFRETNELTKAVKEASLALRLHHKHIISTFGVSLARSNFGSTDLILLMELAEGSLYDHLKQPGVCESLSPEGRLLIARQIAEGLAYLHAKRLLHLDLKPQNILLANKMNPASGGLDAVAKICDMGLSRGISNNSSDETNMTRAGHGTARYASHEQLFGTAVNPRCDVYSLGCIFYWLVTNSEPFQGASLAEITTSRLEGCLRPFDDLIANGCNKTPRKLYEVTKLCIAHDPLRRPSTGREVLALLLEDGEEMPPSSSAGGMSGANTSSFDEVGSGGANAAAAGPDQTEVVDMANMSF